MKFLAVLIFSVSAIWCHSQQYKPVDEKSEVKFTIKNFSLNTSGSLNGLKGTINFDPADFSNSSFNVSVDVSTINTGIDARDNHLKKEDYFDVERYPVISFISTNITGSQNDYNVTGKLTIKGTAKTISFPFTIQNQDNGIILSGEFSINRKDFNIGGGSAVLGNNVNVSLKVFATKN